jgi:hypothetical protein
LVEALAQLAVVDAHAHRRQREAAQGVRDDERDLDFVVRGQRVAVDDVDVGLPELAVATLLRALAAPALLDLVAPEREVELPGVLEDVPRERHGQVEVQTEAGVAAVLIGLQAAQDIDLFGRLALAQQLVEGLDGPRLDVGEPVQLESPAEMVDDLLLDDALPGQQFGEARERLGSWHGDLLDRTGSGRSARSGAAAMGGD